MTITALPDPPSRLTDGPDVFPAKADTFFAALPQFRTEANATAATVNTRRNEAVSAAASAQASSNNAQSQVALAQGHAAAAGTARIGAENARDSAEAIAAAVGESVGLPSLTNKAGYVLTVSPDESGVQWAPTVSNDAFEAAIMFGV